MRGEQQSELFDEVITKGSPPLARGTVMAKEKFGMSLGITPACAGNSFSLKVAQSKEWDHPRLRGEQEDWTGREIKAMGSPPLARGTVDCTPALGEAVGITPACAGNS